MKKFILIWTFALLSSALFSANITWTNGNGTGIWNDAGNWSAGIPGSADYAIFNTTSTANCLIDINIDVRGIVLQSGYTGTVTQGAGITMTVRDFDIFLADGAFVGGDSQIDMINGNFTIRGGTFVSTSDTLFLDVNFVVSDSGFFYHNNGTVVFDDGANRGINVISRDTLFNMVVEPTGNNLRVDLNGADTLTILNKLTLSEGRLRGGVVEVEDSMEMGPNYDLGTSQIWFTGATNSNLSVNGAVGSHPFIINKANATDTVIVRNDLGAIIEWGNASDQLTVISGCVTLTEESDLDFFELEIRAGGTYIATSEETRFLGAWDNQGGLFIPNSGSWVWEPSATRNYRSTVVDTFFNFIYQPTIDRELRMQADDSIYIVNRLDLVNGRVQTGNILIQDTAYLRPTYDDGSADLWFVGNLTSNFFVESAEGNFDFFIRKDNSTDSVLVRPLTGNSLALGETDRDLIIYEGVLSFNLSDSVDLDYSDLFILAGSELIAAPQYMSYQGNWRNQGGSFDANGGHWVFDIAADNRVYTTTQVDTFFSFEMASVNNDQRLNITADDSIYVQNKLEFTNGRAQTGNFLVGDTVILYSTYDAGTADVYFIGSITANYLIESAEGNFDVFIRKDNSTDTVFYQPLSGNSLNIGETGRDLFVEEGVLSFALVSDTVDLDYGDLLIEDGAQIQATAGFTSYQGNWFNTGGQFNANQGVWKWDNGGNRAYATSVVDTFFTLLYEPPTNNAALLMGADDSIYVVNRIDLTEGRIANGNLLVNDTAYLRAAYDDGSADIYFIGSTTSNFFIEAAVGDIDFFIRKDNSTDTVFFQPFSGNSLNIGETDRDLRIQEGVLSFDLVSDTVDLDYSDIFIEPGSQLQASSGVTFYQGNWDNQTGLFKANGGSWIWDNGGDRNYLTTEVDTFFNFNYSPTNVNADITIAADDSIYIANKLELTEGRMFTGNLLVNDTAYLYATYNNGTADVYFIGSTTSNFIIEAAVGNMDFFIRKDNSTDTVFFQPLSGNSLNIGETGRDLRVQEGVLSFQLVSDTVDLDYGDLIIETGSQVQATAGVTTYQGNWNNLGGLFNPNQGRWIWDNDGNRTYASKVVDSFFTFLYQPVVNNSALTLAADDSIYVENRLDLNNGRIQTGNLLVNDSAFLFGTYDDGSADIFFIGSTTSNFFIEAAVGNIDFFIRKDNSTDTVFFQPFTGNNLNIGETDRNLRIEEGILSFQLVSDTVDLDYANLIIEPGSQVQATSGTTFYQGNWDNQGGLFNANSGNWIWDYTNDRTYLSTQVDTFFNLVIRPTANEPLTLLADDSIYIANRLDLVNGRVQVGNLLVNDSAFLFATYDDGSADIFFIGSTTSNFFIEAAVGNIDFFIRKDNSTDTVFFQPFTGNFLNIGETDRDLRIEEGVLSFQLVSDTVDLDYANLIIEPGSQLQATSGLTFYQGNWNNQGGLFNANMGDWTWNNGGNRIYASTEVDTFFNFNYDPGNNVQLIMAADDSIYIDNKLELSDGRIQLGNLLVHDTAYLYAAYDDATADLYFIDTKPSNFIIEAAQGNFETFIRKANPTDTVYFQPLTGSSLSIGETDRDLTIEEGVLSFSLVNEANLDYSDINIQAGSSILASAGIVRYQGNWNNIAGGFNANNGTWIFDLGGDRTYTSHQPDTFFRMIFDPVNGNQDMTITAGDEFTVEQALFLEEAGIFNGTINVLDSLEINAGYDNNGTADIFFEGAGDGTLVMNNRTPQHDFYINKSNTTAKVDAVDEAGGELDFGNTAVNVFVQQGRLEFPANDTVNSFFANTTLSLGGTYQLPALEMNFVGSWVNNQGKLDANGSTFNYVPTANRTYSTTEVDTFFNFTFAAIGNRALTMDVGDTIRVLNDLRLVNGRIRTGVVSAAGDVTVIGTYDADNSQADLQFVGPNPQSFDLTGATGRIDGDIFMDKSIAADVTITGILDIDRGGQAMTFNKGYFVTTQTNILFIDGLHSIIGASDSSFVKGPVTKRGNQNFTFPVGDSVYGPIGISGVTNGSAEFRAEYFRNDPSDDTYDVSMLEAGVNNVSIIEYWQLDRLATGASCNVTLNWDTTSAVVVPAELIVARWNSSTLRWEDEGNIGTTGNANDGSVTSNLLNTFSPFTLGSTTINNPLPVTYKYFEAIELPNANLLEWTTLSEINADYFEVQRSVDGLEWNSIGTVAANGNSTQEINYDYTDFNIEDPIVYYRLIQYDFDGTAHPSEVVVINRRQKAVSELNIYPNPVSDGLITLSIQNQDMSSPRLRIISMQGQVIMERELQPSVNQRLDIDVSSFSQGTYFVRIEGMGEVVTKKLIVL